MTHQSVACDAVSVHFGPTLRRTDIFLRFVKIANFSPCKAKGRIQDLLVGDRSELKHATTKGGNSTKVAPVCSSGKIFLKIVGSEGRHTKRERETV